MGKSFQTIEKESLWTKDFLLICMANLFIFAGFQLLLPVFPLYVELLGGGQIAVGVISGIFAASAIIIRPISGKLIDQGSRKGIFIIGLIISVLTVMAYPWAGGLFLLIVLRLSHGVGFGMSTTAAGTIAADLIPVKRLGEGMGYYGLMNTFAMAIGPALGLLLVYRYDYNVLFLISAVFTFFAILIGFLITIPRFEKSTVVKEYKYLEPAAYLPSLVALFIIMPFGAVISFIPLYAVERGIENIGFFFTIYAVALAFSRPVSGIMSDRHGYHRVVVPGTISMVIAMVLISISTNDYLFSISAVMFGLGIGFVTPSLQSLTVKNVPPNRRGAANATYFSAFDLGIGLGSLLWGIISYRYGYSFMYLISTIPIFIGMIIFLRYYKHES